MGDILKVWDEGNSIWIPIPAIQGAQGPQGPKGDKGDTGDFSPLDAYPIGAFYISAVQTSPAELFGGDWSRIKGQFLLATDTDVGVTGTYAAGSTGGGTTHYHSTQGHTLTASEIPSHHHGSSDTTRQGILVARTGNGYAISRSTVNSGSGVTNVLRSAGDVARMTNTSNTGGGGSHSHGNTGSASNLPPYLAVYVWQRVA